jgi:hypothetical protein
MDILPVEPSPGSDFGGSPAHKENKMKLRLISLFALVLFASASAFAWNCSDPLASRVPVGTTKPSGTAGDGDGQWFLGTGSEGTKGVYYVCEVPKKPKSGGGTTVKSTNTNTNNNSNSNSNSNSNNNSSSSNSSATGGNATSTATGGNSSSKSGVNNSGNSSNTNNNTANGGSANGNGSNNTTSATGGTVSGSGNSTQGQKQGQGQTQSSSSNNSGGNSSNSYSSNTQVDASKIPVNTAFAPTTIPTVSCFKGFGAGVQTMPVGASFGGGKIDPNCRALQTTLHAPNRVTFCKLFINLQDSKAAHITMEDCMASEPKEEVVAPPPAPAPQPINIYTSPVAETPAPAPVAPPEYKTEMTVLPDQLMWSCTFANALSCKGATGPSIISVSSICKSMLLQAKKGLLANPGSILIVTGNRNPSEEAVTAASRAANVKKQLVAFGIPSSRIRTEVGNGTSRTVEVVLMFNAGVTVGTAN